MMVPLKGSSSIPGLVPEYIKRILIQLVTYNQEYSIRKGSIFEPSLLKLPLLRVIRFDVTEDAHEDASCDTYGEVR